MKGRKKISDSLKSLRGTDQPCRMSGEKNNKMIITSIYEVSGLTILKTARAKKIFKEKANQLILMGTLTEMDLEPLALYCNNIDLIFTCMQEMKKGMFQERFNETGEIIGYTENPYVKLYKELQPQTIKQASEFGFTPTSRLKFSIKETETDPLSDLMKAFK